MSVKYTDTYRDSDITEDKIDHVLARDGSPAPQRLPDTLEVWEDVVAALGSYCRDAHRLELTNRVIIMDARELRAAPKVFVFFMNVSILVS